MFIWPPNIFWRGCFVVFSLFSDQFGCRFARKIDGGLLGYGVKIAQKMAPNGLRENRKLQITMSESIFRSQKQIFGIVSFLLFFLCHLSQVRSGRSRNRRRGTGGTVLTRVGTRHSVNRQVRLTIPFGFSPLSFVQISPPNPSKVTTK